MNNFIFKFFFFTVLLFFSSVILASRHTQQPAYVAEIKNQDKIFLSFDDGLKNITKYVNDNKALFWFVIVNRITHLLFVFTPIFYGNKNRTFVYRQRCVFWMMFACGKWCWLRQWWRLRLMMRGFATFGGKHRIIAARSGATSYLRSKCIISPQAMHHLISPRVLKNTENCDIINPERRW